MMRISLRNADVSRYKMTKLLFAMILVLICRTPALAYSDAYLKELLARNQSLKTLEQYKDSEEMIKTKLRQVDNINEQREKYGVPDVQLDLLASRVENKQAREAAENGYLGHWNMNGWKPYLRYGLAGGNDHVMENAYGSNGYGSDADDAAACMADGNGVLAQMNGGLDTFMSEGDGGGHHDNVVGKHHNFVGLGFYCTDRYNARYYEAYIDRYITFKDFKHELKVGEPVTISGTVIPEDTGAYAVIVYYEPFPSNLTADKINAKSAYGDFTDEQAFSIWPWNMNFNKDDRSFLFDFKADKSGYYYVQIYIKKGISDIPYTGGGSASTNGLANASGIVLKVN